MHKGIEGEVFILQGLTLKEILEATGGRVLCRSNHNEDFKGLSIDSRSISQGEIFIALKGQRHDGHDFLMDALKTGAGAIISIPPPIPIKGKTIIYVNNTLRALQAIANYKRKKVNVPVIAVTGTNGKTTTKELIASVLGVRFRVLKSSGNLNNHIGLPLSLVNISSDHDFAVLEMGASIKGDIRDLCEIAEPDYGVLTNIGQAHLESFGSIDLIRDTKLELFEAVNLIVANGDDRFLMEGIDRRIKQGFRNNKRLITYGIDTLSDIQASNIEFDEWGSSFEVTIKVGQPSRLTEDRRVEIKLKIPGRCNIYNALAAVSICYALGVSVEDIKRGIESFEGVPMRLEFKKIKGVTILSDLYNANPASMEQAIKELVRLKKSRAVAILGDMLELGSYAVDAHDRIAGLIATLPIDVFVAVGPMMSRIAEELSGKIETHIYKDSEEAAGVLSRICREGDTVLVKGSRGMMMERILEVETDAL